MTSNPLNLLKPIRASVKKPMLGEGITRGCQPAVVLYNKHIGHLVIGGDDDDDEYNDNNDDDDDDDNNNNNDDDDERW